MAAGRYLAHRIAITETSWPDGLPPQKHVSRMSGRGLIGSTFRRSLTYPGAGCLCPLGTAAGYVMGWRHSLAERLACALATAPSVIALSMAWTQQPHMDRIFHFPHKNLYKKAGWAANNPGLTLHILIGVFGGCYVPK